MGVIKVENIKVYAYHGCLSEETIIGSDYRVDVSVEADLEKSSTSDALEDTVDYVTLNSIVVKEMGIPAKLLEAVAKRIINRVFESCKTVVSVNVSVSKINPPIGGDVEKVTIVLSERR
jgi:7,8-dihydroneopterin aldolase/epimerase/oxygenase